MNDNRILALYVGYYLSRFNKKAYINLGYKTQKQAHHSIGKILKVNPNTIKNMRDEFDPIHGHRVGWHQRSMSPSRVNVVNALQDLSEPDIRGIVNDIIANSGLNTDILLNILNRDTEHKQNSKYVLRGPTGRKAEEYFINYHSKTALPIKGTLKDTRDLGCGYDFEIHSENEVYFIEVKGLAKEKGGLLFTNREWIEAQKYKEKYILILIKNLEAVPEIKIIKNPAVVLYPKKNLYTSINIQWSVSEKDLKRTSNKNIV